MTWPDIAALILLAVCCGLGTRVGSVWAAASLAGGFVGAGLVDTYALTLASMIGGFPGAIFAAGGFLYLAALAFFLIPGNLLSKVEGSLIGVFDGIFGFFTGAAAGFCALLMTLLYVVPTVNHLTDQKAWTGSVLVRPLYGMLESAVNNPDFEFNSAGDALKEEVLKQLPLSK